MNDDELIEAIADKQHAIWSHWMKHLFSVCAEADDGSMLIPKEKVERWQRQMHTPYNWLSDAEQESDRHQAVKVLPELKAILRKLGAAEAAMAERDTPCVWRSEYGGWITCGCSNRPMVYASGFAFCPYCGHRIEVT